MSNTPSPLIEKMIQVIRAAVEQGITFFDTAEVYGPYLNEEIVGEALSPVREQVVIATKFGFAYQDGVPGAPDSSRANIRRAVEGSLKRLNTDYIDLYQSHRDDAETPQDETLEAYGRLVKAGKVRAVGLSNESPWGVHEFVRLADQRGLPRVATVQNPYCLINRTVDNGLDETMHRLDVSLLAYSPLGFGLLTGKYDDSGTDGPQTPRQARIGKFESVRKQRWGREEALVAARRYNQLARDNGMTPTQMALAFCYTKWQVASTIIGVTSVAQLDEDINAFGTTLSPELLAAIDAIRLELRDPAC